jgi:SPO11 homologue
MELAQPVLITKLKRFANFCSLINRGHEASFYAVLDIHRRQVIAEMSYKN